MFYILKKNRVNICFYKIIYSIFVRMIEIKNIHKTFAVNHVLQGISQVFAQGNIPLLIGTSG